MEYIVPSETNSDIQPETSSAKDEAVPNFVGILTNENAPQDISCKAWTMVEHIFISRNGFQFEDDEFVLQRFQDEYDLSIHLEEDFSEEANGMCEICLDELAVTRPCCNLPVCFDCMRTYIHQKIDENLLQIECLNNECNVPFKASEIMFFATDISRRRKYSRLLYQTKKDKYTKSCPYCGHMTKMKPKTSKVKCERCFKQWCFSCYSPNHEGVSCRKFRKEDKLLKQWARKSSETTGTTNAQQCPKCKVYIQRIAGCDHIHCMVCQTDFCYRCGDTLRQLRFFGNHYSRFSIFGCKQRYMNDKPFQRRLIRGAIFGGKLLLAPLVGTLVVCTGALALGVGLAVSPIYGSVKAYQMLRRNRRHKFSLSNK